MEFGHHCIAIIRQRAINTDGVAQSRDLCAHERGDRLMNRDDTAHVHERRGMACHIATTNADGCGQYIEGNGALERGRQISDGDCLTMRNWQHPFIVRYFAHNIIGRINVLTEDASRPHVVIWRGKGDDEIARKEVFAVVCGDNVRIDEDVGERSGGIAHVCGTTELA